MNWYKIAKKITPKMERQMIQMYLPKEQGGRDMTTLQIGELFGVGDSTVLYTLKKNDIPIAGLQGKPKRNRKYFMGRKEELDIIKMYIPRAQGGKNMSAGSISKNMHIPRWLVRSTLKRNGIPIKERPPKYLEYQERVLQMTQEGLPPKEISEKLGITKNIVMYIRNRAMQGETPPTPAQIALQNASLIVALAQKGFTIIQIANKFKVPTGRISSILNSAGVSAKKGPRTIDQQNLFDLDKVDELINQPTEPPAV